MADSDDLSFAGTFRLAPDVAVGEAQWQGFGGLASERVEALLAVFNAASWLTQFWSELAVAMPAALPIDADEPAGVRLSAGYSREALIATSVSPPELVALFPSFRDAERYWFRLDSVDLAADRLQMRANGALLAGLGEGAPGTLFSWYVLDPVEVRSLLRRDRSYRIGVTGLCYVCAIAPRSCAGGAGHPRDASQVDRYRYLGDDRAGGRRYLHVEEVIPAPGEAAAA